MSRIVFHRITFRNFMSYGNYDSSIELDNHKLTIIQGKNGVGKTTSLLALSYNLFGKTFNKALKTSLINNKNKKGLYTRSQFSIGEDEYSIERGEKPSIFKVFKNGEEMKIEGDSRVFQKRLEDEILQFDIKSFTRLICLGYDYIRFFELSTPERREFIENVLDLSVLSDMSKQVKELQKADNDILSKYVIMLDGKKSNKDIYEKQLETLSQSNDQIILEYENKIKTLTEQNATFSTDKVKLDDEVDKLKVEKNNIQTELKEYNETVLKIRDEVIKLKNYINDNNKMIEFFNNNSDCPTCKQHISEDFKNNYKQSLEKQNKIHSEKVAEYKTMYDSTNVLMQNNNKLLEDIVNKINVKNNEISVISTTWKNNNITINDTKKQLEKAKNNTNINDLRNNIEETLNDIKDFENKIVKLNTRLSVYKTTLDILSENGVKKAIIDNYIDIINMKVNEYLEDFNCNFDFNMNSEFDEEINLDFHDAVKYESLSAGQKQRLDLSLFLSFREIAQLRSKVSANVLLLDEITDTNLDAEGVTDLIKILQKQNINIFVISHNDIIKEMVDNTITITKEKYGFSRIQ